MTENEHKQRHIELHKNLNELVVNFIQHNDGALLSQTSVMDLMRWSHEQTINPTASKLEEAAKREGVDAVKDTHNNRSDEIAFLESFLSRSKDVFAGVSDSHWIEVTINERIAQLRAVR